VSILVNDLQRSAQFYQSVFGMAPVSEDKPNQILRLGMKRTIVSLDTKAWSITSPSVWRTSTGSSHATPRRAA
jgi:catechol-2,3-dioxygenase